MGVTGPNCGASTMNSSSLNIHYHGTNTSPTCHQDEVIKTIINPGDTFQYNVVFPANEPGSKCEHENSPAQHPAIEA
jgi:hypothetical protein